MCASGERGERWRWRHTYNIHIAEVLYYNNISKNNSRIPHNYTCLKYKAKNCKQGNSPSINIALKSNNSLIINLFVIILSTYTNLNEMGKGVLIWKTE